MTSWCWMECHGMMYSECMHVCKRGMYACVYAYMPVRMYTFVPLYVYVYVYVCAIFTYA